MANTGGSSCRLNNATKQLLSLWRSGITFSEFAQIALLKARISVDLNDVTELVSFLRTNSLTVNATAGAWKELAQRSKLSRQSILSKLIHSYLFFKIPLVRPQAGLQAMLPYVEVFYRKNTARFIGLLGLAGAYLVSRQWEAFTHTFQAFWTLEGAFCFAACLVIAKTLHELGHALTAARFGCRVPTMGIAFMVLMPLLYTDVTDAWRLRSRRQRVLIDSAGILVELGLACIATFIWAFLPDGPVRGAVFMLATSGWLLSLGLNLNPFMRFDGYFLLSDFLGIDNLQPRAFALGRWKLRQLLFAPSLEPPEVLPDTTRSWMVLYAWAVWLYRLVVFTGIAILVYHFFFKALGILLFFVEIWFFILKPIVTEIMAWRRIESHVTSSSRTTITAAFLFISCLIVFLPWSTRIETPAILTEADLTQIFPARSAKIVSIDRARGDVVAAGATIARLIAPEVDKEIGTTRLSIELTKLRLGRVMVDEADREQYLVLSRQLAGLRSKLDGLEKEKGELIVRSPIAGVVLEMGPDLHPGRWIGKENLIALISSNEAQIIKGYIGATDLRRLRAGALGRFIPDDLALSSFQVKLAKVNRAAASQIDVQELASVHGGRIPVEADERQRLVPISAQYLVELEPQELRKEPKQVVRGVVELSGTSTSILTRVVRNVLQVLIRESGF